MIFFPLRILQTAANPQGGNMEGKKASELLAEIYRNTHYALQSISDILPETQEGELKEELKKMHDGYEKISGKAALCARERGMELKEPNPLKKAMMWGSIRMSTLKDGSEEHIAEMLTQGTVTGITALARSIGEAESAEGDGEVISLAHELLEMEQSYEQTLKNYLR